MTSYAHALKSVFDLSFKRGMHCSLSTIEKLCKIYNHPEKSFVSIHVAGTNGKGSVCTKIAAALTAQGYQTGLYTSPHISTFRERIRVGDTMISEEELAPLLFHIQKTLKTENISATFFEVATLLSFLHFQKKGVQIAVLETGLGGRWDATNVVSPLLSIITSISYDHTEILGESLEEITKEKLGIAKPYTPLLIGPHVNAAWVQEKANQLGCPLYQSAKTCADYDLENAEIGKLALTIISPQFSTDSTSKTLGLKKTPPCRFERHRYEEKDVVFDVAHNENGMMRLLEKLSHFYPRHHYRFLVGFSKGKDISACAKSIKSIAHAVHIVTSAHPRLATTQEVIPFFSKFKNLIREESIAFGIEHALKAKSTQPEVLIITGSFFIMHEAKEALGIPSESDPCLWYDPFKIILP